MCEIHTHSVLYSVPLQVLLYKMQFRSTKSPKPEVSFKDAVLRCLPPDGGLYVPSSVPDMRQFFLYMDEKTTYHELVATVTPSLLQGELNPFSASRVAESAFNFEPELIRLNENFSILNLYNGPSGVFKDFGVAFFGAVLEELVKNRNSAMIVSSVRGDTGLSLTGAFQSRQGIISVLLCPSGPILGLDPSTFVPNGGNIIPIQIRGGFEDCQRLIAELIQDRPFAERHNITSANTINPCRLLPQAFYFLYAFTMVKKDLRGKDLYFSIPSGNFGNFISGLYAWKFGMPVNGFVAAMNNNDAFGDFFRGGSFHPRKPLATYSPAMDIARPQNYERLVAFYEEAPAVMRNMVFPATIDDDTTLRTMEWVWKNYNIFLDPHSAVAFAAAQELMNKENRDAHWVILATGHPAREAEMVRRATGKIIDLPEKLQPLKKWVNPVAIIDPHLDALESAIASCF
jgi:threonine synthase